MAQKFNSRETLKINSEENDRPNLTPFVDIKRSNIKTATSILN